MCVSLQMIDFGLATDRCDEAPLMSVGTAGYMPVEVRTHNTLDRFLLHHIFASPACNLPPCSPLPPSLCVLRR